jgi:hypothetical protein
MLSPDVRLCPNTAEVAAKVMDGEAILINLSDGMYYSLDLVGGLVWQLIEARRSLREIVETVSARYDVTPPDAEADLQRLAVDLLQARLVEVVPEPADVEGPVGTEASAQRLAYEPPRLSAFSDMAELLALDPPHPYLTDTLSKYPGGQPSS